jgi:hypothetical protein
MAEVAEPKPPAIGRYNRAMPVYFRLSSIANARTRRIIEQAIVEAIGERDGDWFVSIAEHLIGRLKSSVRIISFGSVRSPVRENKMTVANTLAWLCGKLCGKIWELRDLLRNPASSLQNGGSFRPTR